MRQRHLLVLLRGFGADNTVCAKEWGILRFMTATFKVIFLHHLDTLSRQ